LLDSRGIFFFAMFPGYDYDDDVLRSISLPADFDPASMSSGMPLIGDFYSQDVDVCRGLAMGHCDFMTGEESMSEFGLPGFDCDSRPDKQAHFSYGDVPPALPVDPDFRLEGTTVVIENSSPERIGMGLLNLLKQEAAATITKVSRIKFSVKAYVHVDGLSCDVKVRVYRQEVGFAVEFQRRSGDVLAFRRLFSLAKEHLNFYSASPEQDAFIDVHRPTVMQAPVAGQERSSKEELSITPLLEMARCTSALPLQAEVAEALAACASDANLSWQLSTPDAFEVREKLAGIDHVSVAHPMRRLSAALAHVAQSNVPRFVEGADHCIFPAAGAPPPPPLMRL
jgi:hypothetical protein